MSNVTAIAPAWSALAPKAAELDPSWLGELRREAFAHAERQGFPTTKHEDWRYTRLAPLLEVPFVAAGPESGHLRDLGALSALVADLSGARLVFVNGHLALEHSSAGAGTEGLTLKSLAAALEEEGRLERHLRAGLNDADAFRLLNTALAEDGAFIALAPGTVVTEPIHLVFIQTDAALPLVVSPRTVVLAGEHSRATIVESYLGVDGARYFANVRTEIVLETGAQVAHYKVQHESDASFHLATLDVRQGRDSRFSSQSVALGGALARHEVQVHLEEEGASVELNGLFMPRGNQHHDNPTIVVHEAGRCASRQLYKGVVDDQAHGVFNGRVVVALDAGGTDAIQTNKNLLLSEHAEIDTRPRLEIFADDVKVSHGAAVGQLDEEALFYLRSRGIAEAEARSLLISAFVGEMLERWEPMALREHVDALLERRALLGADR